MIAAFGTGQVFWSLLWFFLFLILIFLACYALADVFRSHELSGWVKALWTVVIVFVPFVGIVIYLIARGGTMHVRVPDLGPDLIVPEYA